MMLKQETSEPKVSIVIPVKSLNEDLAECLRCCQELDYPDFEILVLLDDCKTRDFPKTRFISTGSVGPAEKRDLSLKYATGEILAFLDDDAYPMTNWLKNAVAHFGSPAVAAVGGPAITPKNSSLYQKASAAVFESRIGAGNARSRYVPTGSVREVDDWPSVNLLIKKDTFEKVGGFNSSFWPGEDTKLCFDITQKLGKKIIYDPKVVVWHHRRRSFMGHLRQVANYALHRGYFAKKFPETSRRLSYFIPTIFAMSLMAGLILAFVNEVFATIFAFGIGIYLFTLILTSLAVSKKARNIAVGFLTLPAIFLTHLFYGFYFAKGLLTKELKR